MRNLLRGYASARTIREKTRTAIDAAYVVIVVSDAISTNRRRSNVQRQSATKTVQTTADKPTVFRVCDSSWSKVAE